MINIYRHSKEPRDEAGMLALVVARQLKHKEVLAALADLLISRGSLAYMRSNNCSQFIPTAAQK